MLTRLQLELARARNEDSDVQKRLNKTQKRNKTETVSTPTITKETQQSLSELSRLRSGTKGDYTDLFDEGGDDSGINDDYNGDSEFEDMTEDQHLIA